MPRAGWAGGMLRAPKLYQSVSISGPSSTSKPMPTKTSSRAAWVWDTRLRCPRSAGAGSEPGTNSVRSIRLPAISSASSRSAISARRSSINASMAVRASLSLRPSSLRASGSRPPRLRLAWASADFLPVSEAATMADLLGRGGPGHGRPGLADELVHVGEVTHGRHRRNRVPGWAGGQFPTRRGAPIRRHPFFPIPPRRIHARDRRTRAGPPPAVVQGRGPVTGYPSAGDAGPRSRAPTPTRPR